LPVTLPPPVTAAQRSGFRAHLGLPDDVPVALFVGRIHPLKGLDLLVEALEPLLDGGAGPVLVVVGRDDGQWESIARRFGHLLARGAVRFAGPLYGEQRFAAYAAADVFCLTPRHWEETSLAALEAAACGTPVVVSEQAAIPGLDEAGGGFVVPLDAARVRAAVREALARTDELGRNARELVASRHATAVVVGRLESYLREAAALRGA
jgi:glycosyltransferase involved in cell wall biosynthesis